MNYKIDIDVDLLERLYKEEINKHLDRLEKERKSLLIDMKELCELLQLSRPTVEKVFLKNPDFPSMRINSKWIFNRKEVDDFLRNQTGEVNKNERN
jgi:predicted DNA-binding transcriptional regulator AlpA